MVSQFCVRPTSKRWFLKIVQVTINMIHAMPCRNPCRLYIQLAFTYSIGPSSIVWNELGPIPCFPPMRSVMVTGSQSRVWSGPKHICMNLLLISISDQQVQHMGTGFLFFGGDTWNFVEVLIDRLYSNFEFVLIMSFTYGIWGQSRLGYYFWVSNGLRTFLDNFTCLVCLDLYCEAYFGSYLHFILHIEYTYKYKLEGIGPSKISFWFLKGHLRVLS